MVNILKPILDKLVSKEQKGFVVGRNIMDVVITSHGLVNTMESKGKSSMDLKSYMYKAYGMVSKTFLKELLKRFNGNFIRMIMSCVKTMKYVQCSSWIYSFLYALCSQQSKPHKEAKSKRICR